MAYGLSNGHVTDDVTWPQRCCEAVRSAILATAWLLVTSTPTGSSASPLSALSLKTDNFKFWWVSRWNITDIYLRRKQTKLHAGVRYCFSFSYSFSYRWREFGATFVERSRRPSVGTRCRRAARRYRARSRHHRTERDLLSGVRRQTEADHDEYGQQNTRDDHVHHVERVTTSQVQRVLDVRVTSVWTAWNHRLLYIRHVAYTGLLIAAKLTTLQIVANQLTLY